MCLCWSITGMKTRSCKAKGKRLTRLLKDKLLACSPDLKDGDIRLPTTSQPGADLDLSPAALLKFPFAFECKNVEKLNIHSAYAQAITHVKPEQKDHLKPVVVFAKNRTEPLVCLSLDDFLWLIS